MAGYKRQLQHHSHEEHAKVVNCVFQEAEPALKRLRITDADVQGHTGLHPDQQEQHQHQHQHQQHQLVAQQQQHQQEHPQNGELPACDNRQLGYPFNSVLRELHMERLQRLHSLGSMQQAPGTLS